MKESKQTYLNCVNICYICIFRPKDLPKESVKSLEEMVKVGNVFSSLHSVQRKQCSQRDETRKKSLKLSANNPAMYCVAFGRKKNQVSSNFFLKGETCVGLQEVNGVLS